MSSLETPITFGLRSRSAACLRLTPFVAALFLTGVQPGWADSIPIEAGRDASRWFER